MKNWLKETAEQSGRVADAFRGLPKEDLDKAEPESLLYEAQDEEHPITDIADERLQNAIKNKEFAPLTKTS